MNAHAQSPCPRHCFCQIPEEQLRPWVVKRYREHRTTTELLQSTDDAKEQEIIAIVALLDVDDDTMLARMGDVDRPEHHILHCRQHVKRMLGLSDESTHNAQSE